MADANRGPRLVPTGDIRPVVEMGVKLQEVASAHDIHNVFDDNGYKELLLLTLFGLRKLRREGDDAEDAQGRRYEIKTVARVNSKGERKTGLQITTEHTLTLPNIARYRQTYLWIVAVFDQAHPEAIYEVTPAQLEQRYFSRWEADLRRQEAVRTPGSAAPHLNNRKIALSHIERVGTQIWPPEDVRLPRPVQEALEFSEELEPDEP
jgi:hypothetical protein